MCKFESKNEVEKQKKVEQCILCRSLTQGSHDIIGDTGRSQSLRQRPRQQIVTQIQSLEGYERGHAGAGQGTDQFILMQIQLLQGSQ